MESLLAINNSNLGNTEEAILDWHIQKMGLEKWVAKWKIVNAKLFPNEYNITELKYFINDFSEEKDAVEIESLVRL